MNKYDADLHDAAGNDNKETITIETEKENHRENLIHDDNSDVIAKQQHVQDNKDIG